MIQAMRPTSRNSKCFGFILFLCCWLDLRRSPKLSSKVLAASDTLSSSSSCGLYLAPSTIPGAGLGIFAGAKGFDYGDRVSYGDIVVPLEGMNYHNGKSFRFLWDEYTWTAGQFPGMDQELDDDSIAKVNGASPGFGAAINCLLPLVNVKESGSWTMMSNAGLDSTSPGIGAFTPYHGRTFYALDDIPSGMELFAGYGENYFISREKEYGPIPLQKHHDKADDLIADFQELKRTCDLRGSVQTWMSGGQCANDAFSNDWITFVEELKATWNSSEAIQALPTNDELQAQTNKLGTTSNEITDSMLLRFQKLRHNCSHHEIINCDRGFFGGWKLILQEMKSIWKKSQYMQVLPDDEDSMKKIVDLGGTSYQHYHRSIRSLKWLREHGTCIDNIKDGISTIPHAGRGAFATRHLVEGSIVAPAPLIHIQDRKVLDMQYVDEKGRTMTKEEMNWSGKAPIRKQLMLNYCFGHSRSTLLLCPYGVLTWLINHSQTKPNAKIQWSKDMRHREWLNESIEKWEPVAHSGLSFDFVATRDIDEGEEILIDFGDEWEQAWQQHVQNFIPVREDYVPSFEMNEIVDLQLRTVAERPYELDGLVLKCRHEYLDISGVNRLRNGANDEDDEEEGSTPCQVLQRGDRNDDSYVAQLIWSIDANSSSCDHDQIMWDIPSDAFCFDDLPQTRDHQQPWAFRHEIMIPDDIFPTLWKNLDVNKTSGVHDTYNEL